MLRTSDTPLSLVRNVAASNGMFYRELHSLCLVDDHLSLVDRLLRFNVILFVVPCQ